MANSNRVSLDRLGEAIAQELTLYSKNVQDAINKAGAKAMKEMVERTKETAPFNAKAYHKHYMDTITSKAEKSRTGDVSYIWYADGSGARLTHLLVHGHETKDGGRTKADPFLEKAMDAVLPDYQKAIEEAIKNG